jgi:hypothetical protein
MINNESSIILNQKILNLIQISSHENILLKSLDNFYENINNITIFLDIINSQSSISIRLIDYFVTKFAKKTKVSYKLNDNSIFNVYQSYKQQLKGYQKKHFDPFARGIRIPYFIKDTCLITTIGQLIFFKWFISKNILDFVFKNKNIIEVDMNKNKKIKSDIKIHKVSKIYKSINIKINKNIITNTNNIKLKNNILVSF